TTSPPKHTEAVEPTELTDIVILCQVYAQNTFPKNIIIPYTPGRYVRSSLQTTTSACLQYCDQKTYAQKCRAYKKAFAANPEHFVIRDNVQTRIVAVPPVAINPEPVTSNPEPAHPQEVPIAKQRELIQQLIRQEIKQ